MKLRKLSENIRSFTTPRGSEFLAKFDPLQQQWRVKLIDFKKYTAHVYMCGTIRMTARKMYEEWARQYLRGTRDEIY